MSKDVIEIRVPDIGDFKDVPIIEVLVEPGEQIEAEQSLVTLESDKATLEIPSPAAGVIRELAVALDDTVSEGTLIATLEVESGAAEEAAELAQPEESEDAAEPAQPEESEEAAEPAQPEEPGEAAAPRAGDEADKAAAGGRTETVAGDDYDFDLLVLGAGPGGYTAAFRAADLGLNVCLVERYPTLGGVCLNVGCIPSKALLHAAAVIDEAASMAQHGVTFGEPQIDVDKLRDWKEHVVGQLTGGLASMSRQRGVTVVRGTGKFAGNHSMAVDTPKGNREITFAQAIIAAGSRANKLSGLPWDDPRLMDSTGALELADIPKSLLVIGGGIIGLEMASVYQGLGSRVTVAELTGQLMPGTDPDLIKPLQKRIGSRFDGIHVNTGVKAIEAEKDGLHVTFDGSDVPDRSVFDRVLVAAGRKPNGFEIGAEAAGVTVTDSGFIPVDEQLRTNVAHIYAIGDIVGPPMLAHKASHEARVAAEVCAGMKSAFEARFIPSVAYTNPEIAWAGLTETRAKEQGIDYRVGKFPWAASGRALGLGRTEGFTKLLFDPANRQIIGAGIVGAHAGDLIAECVLAMEMGCEAEDIGLSIHPHPSLPETIAMSAEVFSGTVTDLYLPGRNRTA